jgi:rfaE bifunctional protein nucleotidyltransferase chain/domain
MKNNKEFLLIASDHNGIDLKEKIQKKFSNNYNFIDLGPNTNGKVDYTDYASTLSSIVSKNQVSFGILICGTGIGMSIAANKFKNVKAPVVHNMISAINSKEHNNANVICLGTWVNDSKKNMTLLDAWLRTKFGLGRHIRRVEKIEKNRNLEKIIFTNGVFDILHSGHIELLRFAKSLGKRLIVGINSDKSVKIIKGKNRPINNQEDRKKILLQLEVVDEVIIFNEITPTNLINKLKPNIFVKGSEFTEEEIRKNDKLPEFIVVRTHPMKQGYSTTSTLKKIKNLKSAQKK